MDAAEVPFQLVYLAPIVRDNPTFDLYQSDVASLSFQTARRHSTSVARWHARPAEACPYDFHIESALLCCSLALPTALNIAVVERFCLRTSIHFIL